ncbi:MAG: hypothetical protein V4637_02370 [Pseudomonadota bacterium]
MTSVPVGTTEVTLTSARAMAQHAGKMSGADPINAVVVGVETAARVEKLDKIENVSALVAVLRA